MSEPRRHEGTKINVAVFMPYGDSLSAEVERVATQIVDAIFKVYEALGAGLLESAYEACLEYELITRGLKVRRQVPVPLVYGEVRLEAGFRIDLLVNDLVIVEVKAVEKLIPLHEAQVLTYLKLSGVRLGILVNSNARMLKEQLKRIVL